MPHCSCSSSSMLPVRAGPEGVVAARPMRVHHRCLTAAAATGNPACEGWPWSRCYSQAAWLRHSLCTRMQPARPRLGISTPGQRSAHLPPAARWRPWASHLARFEPAWPAEVQLLWMRGAGGACLRLLRTLQGQQDHPVPHGGARSSTKRSALHSSHHLSEVQTAGCLLLPLHCPTHRGLVRRCRSSNRHALCTHATCCAMPTTLVTAVSRRLCKSLMRPANNPGLPCFLGFLCCSI